MDKVYQRNFERYKQKAESLLKDNDRLNSLLTNTGDKLKSILDNNDKLKDFTDKIMTLVRMVKAQYTGEYRELPWKTLVLMAGALLYFVTPFDLIPDFLPVIGFTDDLAVVFWIYNSITEDIEAFELWERTIEIEEVNAD